MAPWCAVVVGLLGIGVCLYVWSWIQEGAKELGWWRPVAFLSGAGIALATIVSPLDSSGREGLLATHVSQHLALGDLAAPLLLLGLPPAAGRWLGARLAALADRDGQPARLLAAATSPVGALILWAVATYAWLAPPVHRAAAPDGPVHALDHLSFLSFGWLIWLAAFDPRPSMTVQNGLRLGGLPWWARHVYAMLTRLAMMPLAVALFFISPSRYHDGAGSLPFGFSPAEDQEATASIKVGFEMILFGVAIVLAFIFLAVWDGRQRARDAQAVAAGDSDVPENAV